jgi:amino acid adenylation domain-containing protein
MEWEGQPLAGHARPMRGQSVLEQIHAQALTRPGRIALASPAGSQTFGQCWSRAGAIAAALADSGAGRGETVAVWAGRTPGSVIAALAVMLAGAAYVPIEPTHPAGRCQAVLTAARPRLMLVDGECPIPPSPEFDVELADIATMPADGRPDPPFPRGDDLAYVIFTSGSTGQPKGVMVEHQSLLNYVNWCIAVVGQVGCGTPLIGGLGFDMSMSSLWPQLARGAPVLICGGAWDQEALFGERPEPFSYAKLTPSILRFFERTKQPRYKEFATCLMIGGEILESRLIKEIGPRLEGVRLINHYGPTEATIGCCFHEFTAADAVGLPSVPIGGPIWNTRAYVVDDSLAAISGGQPGELVVAGLGIARGYLHGGGDDVFISEADLGGPPGRAYRTGDYVEMLPSGALLYLGRRDGQLKVSGHRIEPGELRQAALSVAGVSDAAFLVQEETGRLEVFVVPASPAAAPGLGRSVWEKLAGTLPAAVVPTQVKVVSEIVMRANGKCDPVATARHASGSIPVAGPPRRAR